VILKNILVALDVRSEPILERAVQLAVQHGSGLTIVRVAAHETGRSDAEILTRAEAMLRAHSMPVELKADFRVAIGNPAYEIARLARQTSADIVAMGAHQENLIGDLFFETTAYYTIEEGCDIPFLIVKDQVRGPYRRVLAPTDFSSCAKRALRAAMTIAPQAEFNVLHVYEVPFSIFLHLSEDQLEHFRRHHSSRIARDLQEEMDDFLANRENRPLPKLKILVERDDINIGIKKTAKRLAPDLLSMGMSGRGFAALFGSRTNAYLKSPFCDLLITP